MSESIGPHLRAYRECIREIDAIPKQQIVTVNVVVQRSVCVVLAVHSRVLPLRDEILDQLPKFEIRFLDRLKSYARALMWTEIDFTLIGRRVAPIGDQVEQVRLELGNLQADAQALVQRGYLHLGSLLHWASIEATLGCSSTC